MFAKTPLVDGLVVNVNRGLGQETLEAIGDTKLGRRGPAILGTAGTPQVQSCPLCLEPSHLRNHCRHWDALDAYRPNHRVVNIDKNHLVRHRCLPWAQFGTQLARQSCNLRLNVPDGKPVMRFDS